MPSSTQDAPTSNPSGRRFWRSWRGQASSAWYDRYALALPIVFVLATIGPALIGLRTLLSVNMLTRWMPWRAAQGADALGHQFFSTDTVDQVMPGIAYARRQLYAGHIANW
ncbi:MAG: hypothetical protein K6T28_07650 [Acidothermus sp.]|nr:hypothetical protein [Acidothermus sp.]